MENWFDLKRQIYASKKVTDALGNSYALHSEIEEAYSDALYKTILRFKPDTVLEVGMAFGLSSLAITGALTELGKGRLISIDPDQQSAWNNIGVHHLKRIGFTSHEMIHDSSFNALPALLKNGTELDFAYIDGWHSFDCTFVDFFLHRQDASCWRHRRIQ